MQNTIIQIGNFSYYPGKVIGQGATGLVYLGFKNVDKAPIAVKAIKLQDMDTAVKKRLLDCQVLALKTVKNKYVCQAYDVLTDSQYYYVVMEYYPNGTLRNYIKTKGKLTQSEALQLFYKITQGYCSIRQEGLVHRDLKTQNILLRANMQPALIDFGYCQKVQTQGQSLTYNVGSPAYMSPQAYNNSLYSQKSDIWSLGVILHQMVTGTIPIMRTNDVNQYFHYLKNLKTAQILQCEQSQICNYILRCTLTVNSQFRPTAKELKNLIVKTFNLNSPTKSGTYRPHTQHFSPKLKMNELKRVHSQFQIGGNIVKKTPQKQYNYNRNIAHMVQKQKISLLNLKGDQINSTASIKHYMNLSSRKVNMQPSITLAASINLAKNPNHIDNSQNKVPLRQTLPSNLNPNFLNLRKRIQTNNNRPQPLRNQHYIQNAQLIPLVNSQKNVPINPQLAFSKKPNIEPAYNINNQLKKVYSANNLLHFTKKI